jgi:hypothetical protein
VNPTARRALRASTIVLFALTGWTAYANVLSDDTEVRTRAEAAARAHAGCGESCKLANVRGERGMLAVKIAYELHPTGSVVVECRRPYVAFGEYACEATSP